MFEFIPDVPERPPPPAPVRQTSFQAVNNFLVQGISFGSQKATAEAAAANNTSAITVSACNPSTNKADQIESYESQNIRQNITQPDGRNTAPAQNGNFYYIIYVKGGRY